MECIILLNFKNIFSVILNYKKKKMERNWIYDYVFDEEYVSYDVTHFLPT